MRQIYMAVLFFFAATTAFCQNPLLLKDVYPGATGSGIQQIVRTSNYTFFNAEDDDANTDRGLYRTDGTTGGTIRLNLSFLPDPPPSPNNYASTKAEKLTALGNKVIFAGDNFAPGYGEIWASDGTQAGTIALERFQPTVSTRGPVYELAAMNGYVYYGVVASNNKTQIRKTDGTAAGTSLVYEFSSYTTAPEPGLFKVINGILYFNMYDRRGAGNDMIWRTDGTAAGTYMLRDLGAKYFAMGYFMEPVNGNICFMTGKVDTVNFANSKTTLFKTDGTPAGTVPVYDLNGVYNNNLYPSYAVIGNTLYFSAHDNLNGKEIWKTDGTMAGTMLAADIVPGPGSSSPLNLKNFNGQLYFSATTSGPSQFYKLQGNNPVLVKDITIINGINGNSSFAISNNNLVFPATSATSGAELWISDGTTANTLQASDINPGTGGSSPSLITSGNTVYFSANNGLNGNEIFKYDNTAGIAGLHKIYVNDSSTTADVFTTAVGSNANPGTKTSPVASINHALSIAQVGDTIMVDAGLYAEQVSVNKGITIFGAGVGLTKITRPAFNLAAAPGSSRCGVINTVAGIGDFVLKNLTIESAGTASSTNGGFCVVSQTGGEISGCELRGGYLGDGVHFNNTGLSPINIAILNNNFSNIFFFGVNIQGALISAAVNNNSIDVTGSPYGMGILGGGEPAFLDAFSASGNLVKGFNGFGIKYACNNAGTLINNNYFEHSLTLSPGGNQAAPYIQNTGSIQGDASCNWYGTADAELIKTNIVGNLNYGPWLVSGTDLAPAQNGFQPAAGTCTGRQNKFFVNDNSQAGDVFTTAVGNNANTGFSSAPFATINYAISVAQPGDSIIVDAGTYAERVYINKSLHLKGAYAGTSPGNSLNRGSSETILLPAIENNIVEIVTVAASNVTLDGFLLDGDNPAITGSITQNGVDVNAGMGIYNLNLPTDNVVIKNNIFKNFYRYGMLLQKGTSPVLTGALVTRNRIDNISSRTGRDGRGVGFFSNIYGSISENTITRVNTGVIIANYSLGSTASLDISSNNIQAYTTGMNLNVLNNFTSALTVSDNQVSNADLSTWNAPGSTTVNSITGINMGGLSSTVAIAFNNNVVTGTSNGYFISECVSPAGININGGSVSNALQVGVFYIGHAVNPSKLSMTNLSLINNLVGLDVSSTSNDRLPLEFSGVTINGGRTGIRFYGKNISLPGNALTGLSFLNQSKQYILQTFNSFKDQTIDASTVSFEGRVPGTMTAAQLFATEDKLTHKIDIDSVGYFKLKPTEVYITPNSFAADLPPVFGTPTTTPSVKRALGAAAAGDIINIAAGTYTEQLTIDKAITLKGEGAGQTIIARGDTGVLTRMAGFSEAGIIQSSVVAGDIIIRDLTVDGSNGTSRASGPHHAIMLQAGGAIRNCEIKNMLIQGAGSQEGNGIWVSYNGPDPKTIEISNNNLHDFTWVGMNVQGNNLTAAITNNNINAAGAIYGMPMAIGGWGSTLTGLTLTNNAISNYNGFGLSVGSNNAFINYNSFTASNNAPAILNNGPLANATCNWYGVTAAHDVPAKVNVATVNYTPWLSNGTDHDAAIGFQPVAGSCNGTPVVATVTEAINVKCHGANNGSIDVAISGGVAPYSFAWSKDHVAGFSGLDDLAGLAPGEYQLIVTDANGSADTVAATITEPDGLAATATGTNNICHGGTIGTVDLSITGGTLPYSYLWSNGETTESLTGLAAGIYNVTVTDANGCTANASYEVIQPTLLIASITGNSTACSNAAAVTAAGGTGAYSFLWSNGATTTAITSVPAGTYSVTVTDANGCTAVAQVTLTANEAFNPSAQVSNVTCYGLSNGSITVTNVNAVAPFTYSIDGLNFQPGSTFNNLPAGSYTITVLDANGCTGFVDKTVEQPTQLTAVLNTVQRTCFDSNTGAITITAAGGTGAISYAWTGPNGYSSAQRNISNLAAGIYVLAATDNNGCTAPLTAVVAGYDNIIVAATVNNIVCKGELNGSIQLNVTGGTGSGFSYGWSNGAVTKDITNLGVGNYTVTITDIGSGCVVSKTYTIAQPATAVNLSATKTNAAGCGAALGTITATGTGGIGPYTYKLNAGGYQPSGSFAGLYAGSYTVWVKDANGCTKSVVLSITDNGSDQYESNNSKNQAALVGMNTAVNARLALSTDIADWFKFTTPAGSSSYTVSLSHPSVNYTFNVYATGNNTPALVPLTSSTGVKTYTLAGSATYYISITSGARSYNCYELFVGPTPAPGIVPNFAAVGRFSAVTEPAKLDIQKLEAAVYPNPHNGEFNLQIKSPVDGNAVIELFSANGQKILNRTVAVNAGTTTTRFTGIRESLLMYKISIGNRVASGKIIGAK